MPRLVRTAVAAALMIGGAGAAHAQRGSGDWMTAGNDAQRSSWIRNDGKISFDSLREPGFALAWKTKWANEARGLQALTPPALLDFYIGYRGFRTLGFFGGSSNTVVGVDTDLARVEWEKHYPGAGAVPPTAACPGGMTSPVTRPTATGIPANPTGRGAGRGNPAKSGVGEPNEGAVTIRKTAPPPPPPPPPSTAAAKPAPPTPSPFAARIQWVNAVTTDGKFHALYVSNGDEPIPAIPFVPPGAATSGLIVYNNTAYVATTNGCQGTENGVWALDLPSSKVTHWKAPGNVIGLFGPAVGPDGTLYAAGGEGTLTALAPSTLAVKGAAKVPGVEFNSSPVVFEYKDRIVAAVAAKDGKIRAFDAEAAGGPALIAESAASSSPDFEVGALASWQDLVGTRWILAPTATGITAWKLVDRDGKPAFERGWSSPSMVAPLTPIIVNGVVFAVSSGEFRSNDPKVTVAERIQKSKPARLYALDSLTGRPLWNSGSTMTSFAHSGGLAAGGSRIYVSTHDGTQYAFGFPIEH